MAFVDDLEFDCSIVVEFPDGTSATIEFPCGSVFDTNVAGSDGAQVTQLPVRYQIFRERAVLKPCCWWRETEVDPEDVDQGDIDGPELSTPETFSFTVVEGDEEGPLGTVGRTVVGGWAHEATPSFSIEPITLQVVLENDATSVPTKCTHPDAEPWHQGADGAPPCNGAKTECPFYTGPEFKYIKDVDMRPGKPIIGQQVQELRSLIRDWTLVPNAEDVWNQLFDEPFIWGYDKDIQPLIIPQDPPPELEETAPVTTLVQVKWLPEEEDAELTEYPSTPGDPNSGSSDTQDDVNTPPEYFTIISNLAGSSRPPMKMTFPPEYSSQGSLYEVGFTYDTMNNKSHTMYLAGVTLPLRNVYIVNTTTVDSFPTITSENIPSDEEITTAILNLVDSLGTQGSRTGFRVVTTDDARFWHVPEGIDLQPNVTNKIVVLVRSANAWNPLFFDVHYGFHQLDMIQSEVNSVIPLPQTQTLITGWANLTTDGPIKFEGAVAGGDPKIVNAYHYYVYDRSLSRLVFTGEKPDRRYWKVTKNSQTIQGTGQPISGQELRWSLLDNCNTVLIEVIEPKVSAAKPAGLDRAWEPRLITLKGQPEGASGHGSTQPVDVELEVLQDVGEIGRSFDGSLLPARFLIARPKSGQNSVGRSIGEPSKDSVIMIELDTFDASGVDGGGTDDFEDLYEEFPEQVSGQAGGIDITGIGEDVVLAGSVAHDISFGGTSFQVTAAKYDVSYMLEIAGPAGEVLGRKWVYGVGEVCRTWVRDVDIKYAWSSLEASQILTPDYARATSQLNKPEKTFETGSGETTQGGLVTNIPRCGEHEGNWLFSPYASCQQAKILINDGGIIITQFIETPVQWDERYRGPMQQRPFSLKHNPAGVLTKCVFEWTFGTKTRTEASYSGLARNRGPITELINPFLYSQYLTNGWVFPVFGNKGREHVRVYRTMHFREYVYNGGSSGPKVGAGWMPVIPFIGSTGVFDDTKPRTIFDYAVENESLPAIDYDSYSGQEEALAAFGSPPSAGGNQETLTYRRVSYEDAFTVRRPGKIGDGIQWPPRQWYLNFKEPHFMWAFPEPITELARNYQSDNLITGVIVKKPKPEGDTLLFDRFGRPVDVGPVEDNLTIEFTPTQYSEEEDTAGTPISFATLHLDENFPLYFDMETGEIQDEDFEGNPAIYADLTPAEIEAKLSELNIEAEIVPVYTPINGAEEDALPEEISELSEIAIYGNLVSDMTRCYVYAVNGPGGDSIDDEEIEWKGYFRSLEVLNINATQLPSEEFPVEDADGIQGSIAVFGNFPSTEASTREIFSGYEWDALTGGPNSPMLGPADSRDFDYRPYSEDDLELGDPSLGEGSIDPISNTVTFAHRMRVVSIAFSYEIYPRSRGTVFAVPIAGPFTDPTVILKLIGDEDLILIEKPRARLTGDGNTITREFLFDGNDFDPFGTDKITLDIGVRDDATGIRVSAFEVRVTQPISETEEVITLNPAVLLSTGYATSEDEGLYLPSQQLYLSAVTTTADQPDRLEVSNIAELWQPGMASLDPDVEVGTRGKIRRHWAGGFDTWDTSKYLFDNTDGQLFADPSAEVAELRQEQHIKTLTEKIDNIPRFKEDRLTYFLLPQDRHALESINGGTIQFSLRDLDSEFVIVSETELGEGWQPPGYYACLPTPGQKIVQCIVNLGVLGFGSGSRTAHSVYNDASHDTCSADGAGGRSAYALFQFGRITEKFLGSVLGGSAVGAVTQGEAGVYDSITDLQESQVDTDRIADALDDRIQEQLKNLGRYRP